MSTERSKHTAVLLKSEKVLVIGGINQENVLSSCETYDRLSNTWTLVANMTSHRMSHAATLLPSGQVLVTGDGFDNDSTCEMYGPVSNT